MHGLKMKRALPVGSPAGVAGAKVYLPRNELVRPVAAHHGDAREKQNAEMVIKRKNPI